MTERLYYHDSYLTEFSAPVASVDPDGLRVRLQSTAFYPESGGQPADTGIVAGIPVIDVTDEDGDIVHILERPFPHPPDTVVTCSIDRNRRIDHIQQHTGQHLLSAVLAELFGYETISFHMGVSVSTIELATPSLDLAALEAAELSCNAHIAANRPVRISFEDAGSVEGLRKATARQGSLRVVTIESLDRSACGGTHARSTGEIGCVLLRATERIRGNTRLTFVCGLRAVRAARSDYNALGAIARSFSSTMADTPKLVAALLERTAAAEKERAKLVTELAAIRGRDLHAGTAALHSGLRVVVKEFPALNEETKAETRAFAEAGSAAIVGFCLDPPSVLVAASTDSGLHAGNLLKAALTTRGGRGGGSATAAQGSAPTSCDARSIAEAIESDLKRITERC